MSMTPYYEQDGVTIYLGRAEEVLPDLPDGCADCCVTDPPYAEISRPYGRLTEEQWHALMHTVVPDVRRCLTPTGSAVFIIQPNSEKVGRMRLWVWEFMVWAGREWGIVQDAYWWNHQTPPSVHCQRTYGLMRPSLKQCVWVGGSDCFRNQDAVLWEETESAAACRASSRWGFKTSASGHHTNSLRACSLSVERGGVTPYNVIPLSADQSVGSSAGSGHSAGTPLRLLDWWLRYICPPGGKVLDPFMGAGTTAVAAIARGLSCIGIEKEEQYCEITARRCEEAFVKRVDAQPRLFPEAPKKEPAPVLLEIPE